MRINELIRFSLSVITCVVFFGCLQNENDINIEWNAFYEPFEINVLEDIKVRDFGTTLRINKNGRVFFPIASELNRSDTTATWSLAINDSVQLMKINSIDSTLNGDWVISDIKYSDVIDGKKHVKTFKLRNSYYQMSLRLLMRTGL
jgi:hypothetical protein